MANLGIDVIYEIIHALVLKAYGIQHSRRRLGHARIRIALTRLERGAFHDKTAQTVQVDKICELLAVAEGARCRKYRIFQFQRADGCTEVCHKNIKY